MSYVCAPCKNGVGQAWAASTGASHVTVPRTSPLRRSQQAGSHFHTAPAMLVKTGPLPTSSHDPCLRHRCDCGVSNAPQSLSRSKSMKMMFWTGETVSLKRIPTGVVCSVRVDLTGANGPCQDSSCLFCAIRSCRSFQTCCGSGVLSVAQ